MVQIFDKLPFLVELLFNGTFILLYALKLTKHLPLFIGEKIFLLMLEVGVILVPLVIFANVILNFMNAKSVDDFLRRHIFSLIVFIPLVISWGDYEFAFWLASAHLLSSVLSLYDGQDPYEEAVEKQVKKHRFSLARFRWTPAQIVLISFAGLIAIGTMFLKLPFASPESNPISWIDALFMVTSATCVTGLATVSMVDNLTTFGQIVILACIQVGGLGFMTLSTSMAILLGKSMDLKERVFLQDILDVSTQEELMKIVVDIMKYTFFIELWGGIFLTVAFIVEGFDFSRAVYFGFYHAISAFCNAGLSLFNNSFESFATNPIMNFTIGALITLGGLGFIVLREAREFLLGKKRWTGMTVHSKTVLTVSFLLTASGAAVIFFGEFLNTLDGLSLIDKVQVSIFQSITLRTAGFNTISIGNLHSYIIYFMIIYMFIGASPGSTGGGLKTTTFAILVQSLRATLKGKDQVTLFDRKVNSSIVVKSTAIALLSILLVTVFVMILLYLEPEKSFLALLFESVSAYGTVGLSVGITPYLAPASKILISLLMYIGRVGPLTFVLAMGQSEEKGRYSYPEGRIMIG